MAASSSGLDYVKNALLNFVKVGNSIRGDERLLHQLVEVVKDHLRQKVYAFLQRAKDEPVLFSYSADATPLKVASTSVHSSGSGQVVRKGRDLVELLLQRGLFKTISPTGEPDIAFLFTDIQSLSEGKKSGNVFTAQTQFSPMLRKAGHEGI